MKMLQGNVLVTEVEKEKTTAGGIIIADNVRLDKATQPGLVLALSPEVEEMGTLSIGDQVYLTLDHISQAPDHKKRICFS